MANLHFASGSPKEQNGEKHDIPGKSPAAKLALKREGLVNALRGTHELALAMSQGNGSQCQWVLAGDLNTLPHDMAHTLEDFATKLHTAKKPQTVCRKTIDEDKKRDWLVSFAVLATPTSSVVCQSKDSAHFSVTGTVTEFLDSDSEFEVVAISDMAPRPEDMFLRDAVAALEIFRKTKVEQNAKESEARRLEEDERET